MSVNWPVLLRELDAAEHIWNSREVKYPRPDAVPWKPYPLAGFVALLTEAMMVAPFRSAWGDINMVEDDQWQHGKIRLIDVGCGPGTKLRLARAMFDLNVYGIDIVGRFVDEALQHRVRAGKIDAFEFPETGQAMTTTPFGYSDFDIVYVNRPSGEVHKLEPLIMERMRPDAVLIAVNWVNDPAAHGFAPHFQEMSMIPRGPLCGVWIKQ